MQPNVGLAAQQEKVVREFRHDLAKIMHANFEFFAETHPDELEARGGDLSGTEVSDVVERCEEMAIALEKAWKRLSRMYDLEPSSMTPRKTALFNRLVASVEALLIGSDLTGPAWITRMLTGEVIIQWMNGKIPDEEVARKRAERRQKGRPMTKAEVDSLLREKWDAGWRPKAITWIGRRLTVVRLTLWRMYSAAFEFTSEIQIRYLRLTKEQSEAFAHDLPNEIVGKAVRAAKTQEAQKMADDLGLFVEILDDAENIVGDAVPSQDIVKVVMSLGMRTGKVSRGDWSRRAGTATSEGRSLLSAKSSEEMKSNPDAIDFDGAVMVEWSQLI